MWKTRNETVLDSRAAVNGPGSHPIMDQDITGVMSILGAVALPAVHADTSPASTLHRMGESIFEMAALSIAGVARLQHLEILIERGVV